MASLVTRMIKNLLQWRRRWFDPWVRKIIQGRDWLPTPVFLLEKSYGKRSLVGYSPWGHKELDMIEQLTVFTFSKQRCHSHQQLQPPGWWAGAPWGNSRRKEHLPSNSHQTAATPYGEPWGNGMWKHRILASDSWGAYQRSDFREPRLLHLSIHRGKKKKLSSLTWDI